MKIRFASSYDLPTLVSLLESERLIHADLTSSRVIVLVATVEDHIVGCMGLEPYGTSGIVRSVMVIKEQRNKGIARALVARTEALAAIGGVDSLYLLTEHSEAFWSNVGYTTISRDHAPEEVRNSEEFSTLCPSTALCMVRKLGASGKFSAPVLRLKSDPLQPSAMS